MCWDSGIPVVTSQDAVGVSRVLRSWRASHDLDDPVPLVALGASSGGYFISSLAHAVQIYALVIIFSSGVEKAFRSTPESGHAYPPTLFVHMPKDVPTARRVGRSMKLRQAAGVPNAEIQCFEMQLDEKFFSLRIEGVNERLSKRIHDAIVRAKLVNESGYLLPRFREGWKEAVFKKGILGDQSLLAKVDEELNLAFGWHEMTSQHAHDMVEWFQGICSTYPVGDRKGHATLGRCKSFANSSSKSPTE